MNAPNFASLLDEAPTEVSWPSPLPKGTYTCVVKGTPEYGKSAKKGTDFVAFTLMPIAAEEDVDPELLAAAEDWKSRSLKLTFYITEGSIPRLDQFHEHCGIDLSVPASRKDRNDEVMNAHVRVEIAHRFSDDGAQTFTDIKRTLPAD